jgi:hypothetical protein
MKCSEYSPDAAGFYGRNLWIFVITKSVCPWQAFPAKSLMFAGRAGASPTNIRLGWKGLPGTTTLAHYKNP